METLENNEGRISEEAVNFSKLSFRCIINEKIFKDLLRLMVIKSRPCLWRINAIGQKRQVMLAILMCELHLKGEQLQSVSNCSICLKNKRVSDSVSIMGIEFKSFLNWVARWDHFFCSTLTRRNRLDKSAMIRFEPGFYSGNVNISNHLVTNPNETARAWCIIVEDQNPLTNWIAL